METTTNGSFAVVTGASSGIGLELARQFAEHGFDLLIVADSPKITDAANALKSYNVAISEAQIDLAKAKNYYDKYSGYGNINKQRYGYYLDGGGKG